MNATSTLHRIIESLAPVWELPLDASDLTPFEVGDIVRRPDAALCSIEAIEVSPYGDSRPSAYVAGYYEGGGTWAAWLPLEELELADKYERRAFRLFEKALAS